MRFCFGQCQFDGAMTKRAENFRLVINTVKMEEKDFCSYELSKALKACGFDEPCRHYYDIEDAPDGCYWEGGSLHKKNHNEDIPKFSAPTLWHAQKWLREKKGIAINVIAHGCHDKYREGKYHWEEIHLPNSNENGPQWIDWSIYGKHPLFDTYEEALSDGLSQMLELIKKGE